MKTLTGEWSTVEAATRSGIDRTTVMRLRKVAKDGDIGALQALSPDRRPQPGPRAEVAALKAENARLHDTIVELSIENVALRGNSPWGS